MNPEPIEMIKYTKSIIFENSHIYVGCLATLNFRPMEDSTYPEVPLDFSDGSSSSGDIEVIQSDEIMLNVDAYSTAAGTFIVAKSWRLAIIEKPNLWKVIARSS
ncbi:hypothetical protein [Chryseobacterium sp.]|uniref:hypothetical protein n=1 Tax=Chryseobacterium sp. TaxID=1871047 RepID=UPI0033408444